MPDFHPTYTSAARNPYLKPARDSYVWRGWIHYDNSIDLVLLWPAWSVGIYLLMPHSAPRICSAPGCNTLVLRGRCEKHKIVRTSTTKHQKLYSNARWRKLRLMQVRRYPLCVGCLEHGITTTATEVDHIQPHEGNLRLMYDVNNLQSMCKPCHSRKTMKENNA